MTLNATSEIEIKVSKGRIINDVPLEDGTYKVMAKKVDETPQSDIFELIEASIYCCNAPCISTLSFQAMFSEVTK